MSGVVSGKKTLGDKPFPLAGDCSCCRQKIEDLPEDLDSHGERSRCSLMLQPSDKRQSRYAQVFGSVRVIMVFSPRPSSSFAATIAVV
jgi:hypothetical protein